MSGWEHSTGHVREACFIGTILVDTWLKLAEREMMRSRAIHRTGPKPRGQTVAERRLNFRSDAQSSLRDGYLTKISGNQPGDFCDQARQLDFVARNFSTASVREWTCNLL